ncbi:hypothetical protein [Streptomyces griseomycini]|uniref:Uncharacterized protein n=1 Tax=Streptomyces griseomycini TaxID=66895 RepID=A0A7W7LY02_9ACTN|nr:hypothetical protein [Streptomyces griseomycini]MBB4898538.1 hypothetical protein [Streptomyces griseomycini]GGQ16717.1 hypothetical protein GCM10010266_44970 [Streptomyces griseomycini]GGR27912.1 hypothetical protein GCM10015536_36780 [Streptomyces griseomycini]
MVSKGPVGRSRESGTGFGGIAGAAAARTTGSTNSLLRRGDLAVRTERTAWAARRA